MATIELASQEAGKNEFSAAEQIEKLKIRLKQLKEEYETLLKKVNSLLL